MPTLHKYPRTHHLEGSRLQPGDEDSRSVPFASLAGRHLVIEEKLDGANAGLSFDAEGRLRLQSRGHFLAGGSRENHRRVSRRRIDCASLLSDNAASPIAPRRPA